ncbi:AAA family ATPase [Tritonibacter scottomollicae]|uniref:AAA family ATPase n=1 Tax=Tritonibacter scottomollicae TaxID=483013 RepID=UPI003AA7E191
MRFQIVPNNGVIPSEGNDVGFLWTDNWNDWWEFQTLYSLTFFDEQGEKHELGGVKIAEFGMSDEQKRPNLPEYFEMLEDRFFSLGQDVDYYSALVNLGEQKANAILAALRDIAQNEDLYEAALSERVTGRSLLRSVNRKTIEGQFRRILGGGAVLTNFSFKYQGQSPQVDGAEPLRVEFDVVPSSKPPTNIQVLIGRNGVGKTHLLTNMTNAILNPGETPDKDGIFLTEDPFGLEEEEIPFSNAVSVSFSAFDDSKIIQQGRDASKGTRFTQIGLRKQVKDKDGNPVIITRDPEALAKEFSDSAKVCIRGARSDRWRKALATLEADPLFAEAQVSNLVEVDTDSFGREAGKLYRRLSSGHKIVLLTITKLVETVQEKTLVMMDEPEAHLHPPLLSAFVRALSDLLINRNGVAIIATHSPVALQEVPRSCVWKIHRYGYQSTAERPELETFAENVGSLTREVFGFEVTRSGFHRMLLESVQQTPDFQQVVGQFGGQLGAEGRALLSSLIAAQQSEE